MGVALLPAVKLAKAAVGMAEKLDGRRDAVDGVLHFLGQIYTGRDQRRTQIDKTLQKLERRLRRARDMRTIGQGLLADFFQDQAEGLLQPVFALLERDTAVSEPLQRLHERKAGEVPRQCARQVL